MDTKNKKPIQRLVNKGPWKAEEDQRLSEYIEIHGVKKWRSVAVNAGLNRCHKSCRLRWLNYLSPNIKRGQYTDQEEDLVIRLHKLIGNRWSLIAGRIPGRTDNDIKNHWNSHLSKKIKQERVKNAIIQEPQSEIATGSVAQTESEITRGLAEENAEQNLKGSEDNKDTSFNVDEFFDFSNEGSSNLEWISKFFEYELDDNVAGTDGFHQNGSAPYFGEFDELDVFHM